MKYKKGDVVDAIVTSIENYGIFAKLDDEYSGLIHISEITEKYVRSTSDFVNIGDQIKVQIIDDIVENNKLKLSTKSINFFNNDTNDTKIKETVFGFYLLKSSLPIWISKKKREFTKKN